MYRMGRQRKPDIIVVLAGDYSGRRMLKAAESSETGLCSAGTFGQLRSYLWPHRIGTGCRICYSERLFTEPLRDSQLDRAQHRRGSCERGGRITKTRSPPDTRSHVPCGIPGGREEFFVGLPLKWISHGGGGRSRMARRQLVDGARRKKILFPRRRQDHRRLSATLARPAMSGSLSASHLLSYPALYHLY